jgi:protease IV
MPCLLEQPIPMPSDADLLADRRRMRRKLSLWRTLAVLAGIAAVLAVGVRLVGTKNLPGLDRHIARITISGVITGDRRTLELIERVGESNAAAAIIKIDSPGGTVTGSEALYDALRRLATRKPVIAVVDGIAASGGYVAALGADRIVARQTAIVGSIGVLMQMPNVTKLLDTLGVKVESIKSSPLKAAPSGLEPTSPEARAAMQRVIDDSYDWFKALVRTRRGLNDTELAAVSDGRVHTGRQGLPMKLVDVLGDEGTARDWLAAEKKIDRKTPVRDWKPKTESDPLGLWSASARMARAAGLAPLARLLDEAAQWPEGVRLDAPMALWQPPFEQ